MNILNDKTDINTAVKSETEFVEQEQQEYFLLGTFMVTPGLKVYGFNHLKDEVFEVPFIRSNLAILTQIDGKICAIDSEHEKVTVDSRFTYFEALNYLSALKRVAKYLSGRIKELNNLRKLNPDGIDFFKSL